MTDSRVRTRRPSGSFVVIMVTRRLRDIGPTCGALAPTSAAEASTAQPGSGLNTTHVMSSSARLFAIPATSTARRWPNRSAAAPTSGPTSAEPIPTIAELRPPKANESRPATTRVSTPTTIMANGSRATKATGK
ncbi:hypothetical protein MTP03_34780 [Tsukamurella sp. PLM1]|nr:hypothetical protein MTP03_34780 [Tsukamurella sp. PLM1]